MQDNPNTACRTGSAGRMECGSGLHGQPIGMVEAPVQAFRGLYDLRTALCRGTLFSELDLPLEAVGQRPRGCGCRPAGRRD